MRRMSVERSATIEQIVREFHQRVEQALGTPVKVVLFGSSARGEATEGSDIDVLVVVPVLDARVEDLIGDLAWEVGLNAGVVLAVVPVAQDELKVLSQSPFFQAVQREGIPL